MESFCLSPVGYVRSGLQGWVDAPRQAREGAPEAWIEILPAFREAAAEIGSGDEIWVLTWLHQSERSTLRVHPRSDPRNPLTGVFATRSPDRPNPIGLHRVRVTGVGEGWVQVEHLEAIDGTPVVDLKPVLEGGF